MKKPTTSLTTLKFYCDIFGHNYQVSKKVTSHVSEYTCKCCKKQLTTNSNGNLTELTPKYKEINNLLEDFYTRRMLRLKNKSLVSSIY
jgi:transposase-like protein